MSTELSKATLDLALAGAAFVRASRQAAEYGYTVPKGALAHQVKCLENLETKVAIFEAAQKEGV